MNKLNHNATMRKLSVILQSSKKLADENIILFLSTIKMFSGKILSSRERNYTAVCKSMSFVNIITEKYFCTA